jgi:CheY-like chemotaxis protein
MALPATNRRTIPRDTADTRPLVLVADDNVDHVELLRFALTTQYRVITASNGLDAYATACRVRPAAILLDVVMPIVDGYSVVRKLRANPTTAAIPIAMVTGLDAAALEALPGRVDLPIVLRKPCHPGEVLGAVERLLRPL